MRAPRLDAECRDLDDPGEVVVHDGGARDLGCPQGLHMSDERLLIFYCFDRKADDARQVCLAAGLLDKA